MCFIIFTSPLFMIDDENGPSSPACMLSALWPTLRPSDNPSSPHLSRLCVGNCVIIHAFMLMHEDQSSSNSTQVAKICRNS